MRNFKAASITAGLATGLLLVSGSAMAQGAILLNAVDGEVLVNQGESYVVPTANMPVVPGDQVMVTEGGLAKLTYPSGCVLDVAGSFILTVSSTNPCAAGALAATVGGAAAAGSAGAAAGGATLAAGTAGAATAGAGVSTGVIVGSIVGVAALAAVLTNDDEDPISR